MTEHAVFFVSCATSEDNHLGGPFTSLEAAKKWSKDFCTKGHPYSLNSEFGWVYKKLTYGGRRSELLTHRIKMIVSIEYVTYFNAR